MILQIRLKYLVVSIIVVGVFKITNDYYIILIMLDVTTGSLTR